MKTIQISIILLFSLFNGCSIGPNQIQIETVDRNILQSKSIALMGSFYYAPGEESNKFKDMGWELDLIESERFSNLIISSYPDLTFIPFGKTNNLLFDKDLRDSSKTILDVLRQYCFITSKAKFKGYGSRAKGFIAQNAVSVKSIKYFADSLDADGYAFIMYFPVIHAVSSGSIFAFTRYHISVVGSTIVLDRNGQLMWSNSIYVRSHEGSNTGFFGSETRAKKLNTMLSYNFKPIMCKTIYNKQVKSFTNKEYNEIAKDENLPPFILPTNNGAHIFVYWRPKKNQATPISLNLFDAKENMLKSYSRTKIPSFFELGDVWTDFNLDNENIKFQITDAVGDGTPKYSISKNTWE